MRRERGFTLVELLAALVAGSLLLVLLGWNLSTLVRQLTVSPAKGAADTFLALAPVLDRLAASASPAFFEGSERRMAMLTSPPHAPGPTGPVRLRLEVVRAPNGDSLHASFEPAADGRRWPEAARSTVLAEGMRNIRFEYLSREGGEEPERQLPQIITIHFDDGDRTRRVSMRPRLDSEGGCRFDPISMTCRP